MKNSVEKQIVTRARREKIQERTALLLARLTARSGRFLFVPDDVLVRQLGLETKKKDPTYRLRNALKSMNQKGLLKYHKTPEGWSACLTPAGKKYAERLELEEHIHIPKPKRWDGRWRVVMFDIWERRRSMRDKLRHLLKKAGFYKIQNSVWVYPYDCEEFISILKIEMHLGGGMLYLVAEGIEGDQKIKDHFKLP